MLKNKKKMFCQDTAMELLGVAQRVLQQDEVVLRLHGDSLQGLPLALELVDRLVRDGLAGVHAGQQLEGCIGDGTRRADGVFVVRELLGDARHDFSCSLGCNIYYYK